MRSPRLGSVLSVLPLLFWALGPGSSAAWAQGAGAGSSNPSQFLEMSVATVGVDLDSGAALALLHSDWDELLPIWIGDVEARAIAQELQGVPMARPMTHDLLASVIREMGGTLEEIQVHDLQESTYLGRLLIRVDDGAEGTVREVDSRPSDALALAVRMGAKVSVNPSLVSGASDVNFLSAEGEHPVVRLRGVTVGDVSQEHRDRFSVPDRPGVVVLHATEEVGTRGIQQGDLIVEVDGTEVNDAFEFLEEVGHASTSTHIPIRVLRNGEEREGELLAPSGPGRVGP